jgi:thiamine-phosphate pyrophosphorylase
MNAERVQRLRILGAAGVYLVTDDRVSAGARRAVVEQALLAGVWVVQLRDKRAMGGAMLREASDLVGLCGQHGGLLIVNDRVDVAVAAGADGVHVGQDDLPLDAVKRLVPAEMLVGVSASTLDEAIAIDRGGADYLGFGAMFPTATKDDAEYAGPALLAEVLAAVRCPVVAIGGITAANLAEITAVGGRLVAVVSAIFGAADPRRASADLLAAVRASAPSR